MFIIRFLHFLMGVVPFEAIGGFPERFLNLCVQNKIALWDCHSRKGILTACTTAKGYLRLRAVAKQTGMRLHHTGKSGLPFLLRRYRRRWGIAVGLLLFVTVLCVLSSFIWSVKVVGNETVSTQYITDTLASMGLKSGVLKSSIDPSALQSEGLVAMPELSWLAVNIKGSSAVVEVKERGMPPEIVPSDRPCNIKATQDGVILDITALDGVPMVQQGDAVVKGQLLISGTVEDKVGHTMLKHARGTVIAQTQRDIVVQVPYQQTKRTPSDKLTERRSLVLFGLRIPLTIGSNPQGNVDVQSVERPLSIGDVEFPISVRIDRYQPYTEEVITLSPEQAEEQARQQATNQAQTDLAGIEILNQAEDVQHADDVCTFTIHALCKEEIGLEEEIQYSAPDSP